MSRTTENEQAKPRKVYVYKFAGVCSGKIYADAIEVEKETANYVYCKKRVAAAGYAFRVRKEDVYESWGEMLGVIMEEANKRKEHIQQQLNELDDALNELTDRAWEDPSVR